MRRFLRLPSPAMAVAVVAAFLALSGVAWAATGQLVNITDPDNAARKAGVTGSGELKTSGRTVIQPGGTQLRSSSLWFVPTSVSLFGPTTATLAVDHVIVRNPYGNAVDTTEQPAFRVSLVQFTTTSGTCTTSGTTVAQWTARPGETLDSSWTTPMVFKPTTAGVPYCVGFTTAGDPSSPSSTYYLASISAHGSVLSGTYSGPGTARAGQPSLRGDVRYTPGDKVPAGVVGGP